MKTTKTREELAGEILDSYQAYYDIQEPQGACKGWLRATASYHARGEKYVLVRRAKLWGAENNEYVFLFSLKDLDEVSWVVSRDYAMDQGLARIKPHGEHMCSLITAVFLADHVDPDLERELKRFHYYKSFRFSLHGWTAFQLAVVDLTRGRVITNREGKRLKQYLERFI